MNAEESLKGCSMIKREEKNRKVDAVDLFIYFILWTYSSLYLIVRIFQKDIYTY